MKNQQSSSTTQSLPSQIIMQISMIKNHHPQPNHNDFEHFDKLNIVIILIINFSSGCLPVDLAKILEGGRGGGF